MEELDKNRLPVSYDFRFFAEDSSAVSAPVAKSFPGRSIWSRRGKWAHAEIPMMESAMLARPGTYGYVRYGPLYRVYAEIRCYEFARTANSVTKLSGGRKLASLLGDDAL